MRKLLIIWVVLCSALGWSTACPSGASKVYKLVLSYKKVPSNQTNFPVPICFNGLCTGSLTLPQLKSVANGGLVNNTAANSSGVTGAADVWFCDAKSGGNLIKFENSYYDQVTGKGIWWYQKTLSASADNIVWLNIGKASQTASLQDLSLWNDVGYLWVIHASNPTTLERAESVGFLGTKTTTGTVTETSGPLGGALVFTGAGNLQYGRSASTDAANSWAYEQWIKPSATTTMILQTQGPGSGCATPAFLSALVISNNLQTDACYSSADHGVISTNSVGTGSWVYAVGGSEGGSPGTFRSYFNGVADATTANFASPYPLSTNDVYIGGTLSGANRYSGQMFELRKSNQLYPADWYKMNYAAMTSPGGLHTIVDVSSPSGMTSGAYCVPVTIDHTKVPNTDRTDYWLNVFGDYTWMGTIANGGFAVNGNSGHDIRWFSNSICTTSIPFQRVFWTTTGYSQWRVKVASVSHTTDTTVYVKIGSSADTADASVTIGSSTAAWVNAMLWGDPTSTVSTQSSGSDGLLFTANGSPDIGIGPMGPALYLPPGGTSYIEYVPGTPFFLSTFGYPTDNLVSSISVYFQATNDTLAQAAAQSGATLYGYGCALHGGGCNSTATDGARQFLKRKPAFGNEIGMNIGSYDNTNPSVSTDGSVAFSDNLWHRLTFVYTPSNSQINAGTVLLLKDGVVQTATYVSGTTVLHTTNGGTLASATIAVGRAPAHNAGPFTGFIGPAYTYAGALTADDDATYWNNDISPFNFYSFGVAGPAGSTSVRHRVTQF